MAGVMRHFTSPSALGTRTRGMRKAPKALWRRWESTVKDDILKLCRDVLPRHKVTAAISFVPELAVASADKLARRS
jgi:hypothetical protein